MWSTGQFARQKEKLLLCWSLWPKGRVAILHPFGWGVLALCSAVTPADTIPVQEKRLHLSQRSSVTSPSWPGLEELFPGEKLHKYPDCAVDQPWNCSFQLQGSKAVCFLRNKFSSKPGSPGRAWVGRDQGSSLAFQTGTTTVKQPEKRNRVQ